MISHTPYGISPLGYISLTPMLLLYIRLYIKFMLMPLSASLIGRRLLLKVPDVGKHLFLGLVLGKIRKSITSNIFSY